MFRFCNDGFFRIGIDLATLSVGVGDDIDLGGVSILIEPVNALGNQRLQLIAFCECGGNLGVNLGIGGVVYAGDGCVAVFAGKLPVVGPTLYAFGCLRCGVGGCLGSVCGINLLVLHARSVYV